MDLLMRKVMLNCRHSIGALGAALLLSLSACNDDATGPIEDDPVLLYLEVRGNGWTQSLLPPRSGPDPSVIDSQRNNGVFSLLWEVDNDRPYVAELTLHRSEADPGLIFWRGLCGLDGSPCLRFAAMECRFSSQNRLSCREGEELDLSNWFEQLPQTVEMRLVATAPRKRTQQSATVTFR